MTSLFFAMLGFGSLMAFFGFLLAWVYRSLRIEELNSDLEIKQESYQALKGQYETNIKKYEALYHKQLKLEEENDSKNDENHPLAQQDSDFLNDEKQGESSIEETVLEEDTIKDTSKQIEIEK